MGRSPEMLAPAEPRTEEAISLGGSSCVIPGGMFSPGEKPLEEFTYP